MLLLSNASESLLVDVLGMEASPLEYQTPPICTKVSVTPDPTPLLIERDIMNLSLLLFPFR